MAGRVVKRARIEAGGVPNAQREAANGAVPPVAPKFIFQWGVRLKSGKTLASNRFLKGFLRGSNRQRIGSGSARAGNRVRTDYLLITNQLLYSF